MIEYENQCVNCGLPCLGNTCPNRNVAVFICDQCRSECSPLYIFDGQELCEDCILDSLTIVEGSAN